MQLEFNSRYSSQKKVLKLSPGTFSSGNLISGNKEEADFLVDIIRFLGFHNLSPVDYDWAIFKFYSSKAINYFLGMPQDIVGNDKYAFSSFMHF